MTKEQNATQVTQNEISTFIQSTLHSIYKAVSESNFMDMSDGGISILMGGVGPLGGRPKPVTNICKFEIPEGVQFDIAISVSENSSIDGGLDLKVAKVGANSRGESSTVSRVNFTIPITRTANYE